MNVPNNRVALLELMRQTGNDLLAPACKVTPEIVAVISALEEVSGVELAQLSGSGPTCFGVFATAASATHAAETIRTKHPDWWIEQVVIG